MQIKRETFIQSHKRGTNGQHGTFHIPEHDIQGAYHSFPEYFPLHRSINLSSRFRQLEGPERRPTSQIRPW